MQVQRENLKQATTLCVKPISGLSPQPSGHDLIKSQKSRVTQAPLTVSLFSDSVLVTLITKNIEVVVY